MSSKKIICHYSVLLILQYLATGWPMVLCLSNLEGQYNYYILLRNQLRESWRGGEGLPK